MGIDDDDHDHDHDGDERAWQKLKKTNHRLVTANDSQDW
jgi:hypothetical protein